MLSKRPGLALARDKQMANAIFWAGFETYENMEIPNVIASGKTHDHEEGVNSFLEKRSPVFTNS